MNHTAEVYLWGTRIGIIHLEEGQPYVSFEYDRNFAKSGIEISPLSMPLSNRIYSFPNLPLEAFHGGPGMLADSLPDKFGNAVINQWLAGQGRTPDSFNVIERLCYTGARGMGALEYVPASGPQDTGKESVDIGELVRLASSVLKNRESIHVPMTEDISASQLLRLGTSAGGARAKAVIAWNEETNDRRMVFNCLAVNQDDHVKNVSFLMDKTGTWSLSPAYDITFAYDSGNRWLKAHQMTVNGKQSNITFQDLLCCGKTMDIRKTKCIRIIEEVKTQVERWEAYAEEAGVREHTMRTINDIMKNQMI